MWTRSRWRSALRTWGTWSKSCCSKSRESRRPAARSFVCWAGSRADCGATCSRAGRSSPTDATCVNCRHCCPGGVVGGAHGIHRLIHDIGAIEPAAPEPRQIFAHAILHRPEEVGRRRMLELPAPYVFPERAVEPSRVPEDRVTQDK